MIRNLNTDAVRLMVGAAVRILNASHFATGLGASGTATDAASARAPPVFVYCKEVSGRSQGGLRRVSGGLRTRSVMATGSSLNKHIVDRGRKDRTERQEDINGMGLALARRRRLTDLRRSSEDSVRHRGHASCNGRHCHILGAWPQLLHLPPRSQLARPSDLMAYASLQV